MGTEASACGPDPCSLHYNRSMSIAIFGMRVLEFMFFAGLAGSAIVVVISFLEDGKELFGKD